MENLNNWLSQCTEKLPDVKEYEDSALALLNKIYFRDEETKNQILLNPLNKNFYEKGVKKYKNKFIDGKIILWSLVIFIFSVFDNCIARGIRNFKDTKGGINAFFSGFPKGIIGGLIIGFISAIILIIILNVIKIIMVQSQVNTLNTKAENLEEFLKPIPPKYRNYECLIFISTLFFECPDLILSEVLDNCDEFIRKNRERNIRGILYDIPYDLSILNNLENNIPQTNDISQTIEESNFDNLLIESNVSSGAKKFKLKIGGNA